MSLPIDVGLHRPGGPRLIPIRATGNPRRNQRSQSGSYFHSHRHYDANRLVAGLRTAFNESGAAWRARFQFPAAQRGSVC